MTNNTKIQTLINQLAKELDTLTDDIERRRKFLDANCELDDFAEQMEALEAELDILDGKRTILSSALSTARDIRDDEFEVCDFQVLKSDFDFAMAGSGQTGRCKLEQAHNGGHDVRTR